MVGADVAGGLEPEHRHLGQHPALVGDRGRQDDVVGRDPVGGDHQQVVVDLVHLAHLARGVEAKVGEGVGHRGDANETAGARSANAAPTDTPAGYSARMVSEDATTTAGYVSDKEAILRRLARIEGQVGGLRRMVEDEAYCVDVLTQVAAVTKALEGVSLKLLADHTNHCVRDAVERGGAEADEKVDELLAAVERFARTELMDGRGRREPPRRRTVDAGLAPAARARCRAPLQTARFLAGRSPSSSTGARRLGETFSAQPARAPATSSSSPTRSRSSACSPPTASTRSPRAATSSCGRCSGRSRCCCRRARSTCAGAS